MSAFSAFVLLEQRCWAAQPALPSVLLLSQSCKIHAEIPSPGGSNMPAGVPAASSPPFVHCAGWQQPHGRTLGHWSYAPNSTHHLQGTARSVLVPCLPHAAKDACMGAGQAEVNLPPVRLSLWFSGVLLSLSKSISQCTQLLDATWPTRQQKANTERWDFPITRKTVLRQMMGTILF